MKEIYKDIPNYEGLYKVSNFGNVIGLDRVVPHKRWGHYTVKGRRLKLVLSENGYYVVTLVKNTGKKNVLVHSLVATVFIDRNYTSKGLVVNHIDGNKTDNNIDNIEVVTVRENSTVCYRKDKKTFASKFVGVSKSGSRWMARMHIDGKSVYLGTFDCEKEAGEAYKNKLKKIKQND